MKVYISNSKQNSFNFLALAYRTEYHQEISMYDIERNDNGKPFFINTDLPFFNMSHSGEYMVCVFDKNEIGIDIQKIRKVPELVVKRYLRTNSKNKKVIITEWTKFESFGKMLGIGIPYDMDYSKGNYVTFDEVNGYIITVCYKKRNDQDIRLVTI